MRVAYLCTSGIDFESGVGKKIIDQAQIWRAYGCQVSIHNVFYRLPHNWNNLPSEKKGVEIKNYTLDGMLLNHPKRASGTRLIDDIRESKPNLIYYRWDYFKPFFKNLFTEFPAVAEFNSNDLEEFAISTKRAINWILLYHRFTRSYLMRLLRGAIYVSEEISQLRENVQHSIPSVVIPNSINIENIRSSLNLTRNHDNGGGRVVFIGTGDMPWHGLDEIVKLARAATELQFDIIGTQKKESDQAPSNVKYHGQLTREEYQPILNSADIAIGSAACFRKKMQEACPLKTREYLANGIPVVLPYKDTAIGKEYPWALKIGNRPGALLDNKDQIVSFASAMRGYRIPVNEVHHLIDSRVLEKRRLNFFKSIIEPTRP